VSAVPPGASDAQALPPGLRWADRSRPGWTRRRAGERFEYLDARGAPIDDPAAIARIEALAIPPAYEEVWICPDPRGHLQATARDARGRLQYRYHARWRETRDADKYDRMLAFGAALPRLRATVERDLARAGMPREKVLASIVRLMDRTLIRVGNAEYARENGTYGLTTLRGDHAQVRGDAVRLRFRGKSGVEHDVTVRDPRIARIVRRCQELPGQGLFTWVDDAGCVHEVDSADVNAYLREATGADFTAKDYRTWGGSAHALHRLAALRFETAAEAKRHLVETIREAAARLGNTPAVCRRCYVHPAILEGYLEGTLHGLPRARPRTGLEPEEVVLVAFLRRLARPAAERRTAPQRAAHRAGAPRAAASSAAAAASAASAARASRRVGTRAP